MKKEIRNENRNKLEAYFRNGCKAHGIQKLGMELEHFVVDIETERSITYAESHGVGELLETIRDHFPHKIYEQDHLLGLYNDDYSLTLEPAGQLEISIMPREQVADIHRVYKEFLKIVEPVLKDWKQKLVCFGYQPVSTLSDLPLIPKKRYEYMDRYLQKTGNCGRHMMRGTASTQIAIDYCSEEDFCLKYRVAYLLTPALKLLCDNTPVFDGKIYDGYMARSYIWDNVDPARCGILPGIEKEDFGFGTYVDYLWNLPLIFVPGEDGAVYVGDKTPKDLWENRFLTDTEIEHILSMTFLDVRLKNYLEIRGADSMPIDYVLGYLSLMKGVFFHQECLEEILGEYPLSPKAIQKAQKSLELHGTRGIIYGEKAEEFLCKLMGKAEKNLDPAEVAYLNLMKEKVERMSGKAG